MNKITDSVMSLHARQNQSMTITSIHELHVITTAKNFPDINYSLLFFHTPNNNNSSVLWKPDFRLYLLYQIAATSPEPSIMWPRFQ